MNDTEKALACLAELPAWRADDYESWVLTGMILKSAGCSVHDWDAWSRSSGKYKAGVCESKWNSFNGSFSGTNVNVGTLVAWIREDGRQAPTFTNSRPEGKALSWDSTIGGKDAPPVNPDDRSVPDPAPDWAPGDLVRYLEALYQPDEFVSYAAESRQDADGRFVPSGQGTFWLTRAQIIERLR
ncbi:MAG: PriCT-2 domain-containing protein, partial [Kiritimatiellia bacterium]